MDTVDVIIATYGNREIWDIMAERATASAENQTIRPTAIWRCHGEEDLASARNAGVEESSSDWLIFLDADDELDPYYVEAMLEASGDIRQPSTIGVTDGVEDDFPVLIPPKVGGFMVGNHLVIGSMVRRKDFIKSGGFRDLPVLEDWDLWIRLRLEGAQIGQAPKALYRVHVRAASRNSDPQLHGHVYSEIQQRYQQAWYAQGLE
jgi:glycosyltransferase involved in cell wall biosynthesis